MISRLVNRFGRDIDVNHWIPETFFHNFTGYSVPIEPPHRQFDIWTTSEFIKRPDSANLIVFGSDSGFLDVVDIDKVLEHDGLFTRQNDFKVSQHMISCVRNIPETSIYLVVAGSGDMMLTDPTTRFCENISENTYSFHETVKTVSVHQNDSNVYASSSKEGSITIWDRRIGKVPKIKIQNAHRTIVAPNASIDCLIHADEQTLISSSTSLPSGIRFWDLRYQKVNKPMKTLEVPGSNGRISDLGLDRTCQRLFAVRTKDRIFEYSVHGETHPINAFQMPNQYHFKTSIKVSPLSDHFMITNDGKGGLLYDFQPPDNLPMAGLRGPLPLVKDQVDPRFEYPGIAFDTYANSECLLDWSFDGRYIIMGGNANLMIWSRDFVPFSECPPLKVTGNEDIVKLYRDQPLKFKRIQYTKEYAEKVQDPRWNYRFGLAHDQMYQRTDLLIRRRSSLDQLIDKDLLPPSQRNLKIIRVNCQKGKKKPLNELLISDSPSRKGRRPTLTKTPDRQKRAVKRRQVFSPSENAPITKYFTRE
uniref:Uncharacterized protein n=1 Tax=Panagrolaimus sp. JU765 TaxID=591449 RepID=A0AC34Q0B6_9BILA